MLKTQFRLVIGFEAEYVAFRPENKWPHWNDRSTSQISAGWIDLYDDNIENIVIRTEYRLKVSTIHIVSDQWNGTEP